MTNLVKVH